MSLTCQLGISAGSISLAALPYCIVMRNDAQRLQETHLRRREGRRCARAYVGNRNVNATAQALLGSTDLMNARVASLKSLCDRLRYGSKAAQSLLQKPLHIMHLSGHIS